MLTLGPSPKSIYSSIQMESYRNRLKKALATDGVSSRDIVNNTDYKTFISNYVQTNVIATERADAIAGYVNRLANMEFLARGTVAQEFTIINRYRGHHLIETIYFAKDGDNLSTKRIKVIPDASSILII